MEAFATLEDMENRYGPIGSEEEDRVSTLLSDASIMLETELTRVGKAVDDDDAVQAECLKIVCCSMVNRVISSGDMMDITQASMTAGPYTQSMTYSNPSGDMYLTKNERRMLGIPLRKQRLFSIEPMIHGGQS